MADDTDTAPRIGLGLKDFAFNGLATPNIARVLFALTWLGLTLITVPLFILGVYYAVFTSGWWILLGLVLLVAAPIVWLVGLLIVRILLEAAVMLYRIEANTRT